MTEQELFLYLRKKGRETKKHLGQHLLINKSVSVKMVEALQIQEGERILEIGAGFASLSFFLAQKAPFLTLLDVDPEAITFLNNLFLNKANTKIVNQNILEHDISEYDLIVGNLPYYLTKAILEHLLLNFKKTRRALLMIQKEAAAKLFVKENNNDYNPLAILINYIGGIKKIIDVNKGNFVPQPNVDSVVVQIDFMKENNLKDIRRFYNLLNNLFKHRRKTIYNNLNKIICDSNETLLILQNNYIDQNKRPHEVTFKQFVSLFEYLKVNNDKI